MDLLFITTQFPYPLDNGGKIGAFNGISVVSDLYNVTVLSFTENPEIIDEGILYFKRVLPNVTFHKPVIHDIHIRKKPLKLIRVMIHNYLHNLPYVIAKFEDANMYKRINALFANGRIWDAVFIDYLNMSVYGRYIRSRYGHQCKHFIFKDHNREYELVRQEAEKSSGLKSWLLSFEWKRTLKYEIETIQNAELVFSVCDENTNFCKKYNANAYTMLPTYDMLPSPERAAKPGNGIIYIGNLSWSANLEGLTWFVDHVLAKIRQAVPDATLTVVGSGLDSNPFHCKAGIDYRGYIKDISKIYLDQKVFIVPLFLGSGIRIKILDAFNNEIAVVSTRLGCGTINAVNGRHLFIADTEAEFSEAVIRLLRDDGLNHTLIASAKDFLRDQYSLTSRRKEFEDIVGTVFQ